MGCDPLPSADLPNLTIGTFIETSPESTTHNCFAWAVGDVDSWWGPFSVDEYWPDGVQRSDSIVAYMDAFATRGYSECADGTLEDGFEKIALYGALEFGQLVALHAAKQLPNGHWSSKLGGCQDIEHFSLEAVVCDDFGKPLRYLKKPLK